MDHADERRLRDAALAGDADAWRVLFDASFESVSAYVHWRAAGVPDLAEDAVQETWLLAVRRLGRFDPAVGRFAGWVCGLAGGVVQNLIRTRTRQRSRTPVPVSSSATPDADTAERVAAALAELPERYERVLRMKYLDGLTVDEIASASQESVKAAESLLGRARQAFREVYERGGE